MSKRKKLQELTIKDNFMFGVVMADGELCREFLELVLKFPIAKVTVSKENSSAPVEKMQTKCRKSWYNFCNM